MKKLRTSTSYGDIHTGIVDLLEAVRRTAARSVNALMTASYWEIGRRIVEFEQGGEGRAEYGEALLKRLGDDLTRQFGRGFAWRNLTQMRAFYLAWPAEQILQTVSAKSSPPAIHQTPSEKTVVKAIGQTFLHNPPTLPRSPLVSRSLGRPMSVFCPSGTMLPAPFTKPRPCAAVGRCVNSDGRSTASFTSGSPFPGIRQKC